MSAGTTSSTRTCLLAGQGGAGRARPAAPRRPGAWASARSADGLAVVEQVAHELGEAADLGAQEAGYSANSGPLAALVSRRPRWRRC